MGGDAEDKDGLDGAHGPEGPEGKLVPSSPIDYFRINTEVTNVAYPSWPTSPFWGDRPARGRHQHRFGFASDTARARPLRAAAASKTLLYLLVATNGLHKISNTLSFEASICFLFFFLLACRGVPIIYPHSSLGRNSSQISGVFFA